jgi:hypothetical protein
MVGKESAPGARSEKELMVQILKLHTPQMAWRLPVHPSRKRQSRQPIENKGSENGFSPCQSR